jgi:hypothetical protein
MNLSLRTGNRLATRATWATRMILPVAFALLLGGCAPAPAPVAAEKPKPDVTKEAWYGTAVNELADMNREAVRLLESGKKDDAAAVITKGRPLAARLLLAASQPTLAATEAASDLTQLYAGMLLGNRNYGWARLEFQKNVSRWKNWKPQTEETARRLELALAGIRECDKRITE